MGNIRSLYALFFLSALLFLSSSLAPRAFANGVPQTYTVNTTADTDDTSCDPLGSGTGNQDCTLRDAINAANAHGPLPDTIDFNIPDTDSGCSSPNVCTIQLTSALPLVSDNLTIDGSAQQITISGNDTFRIFNIAVVTTFNVNALTITKGFCNACDGGAIHMSGGGVLNLNDSMFIKNNANNGSGGAVVGLGSTVNITNTTFLSNTVNPGFGGALSATSGTLIISNSTFMGNNAIGSSGGAISAFIVPNFFITNSTFSGNSAGFFGGGLFNDESNLNVFNSIIADSGGANCYSDGGVNTIDSHNLSTDSTCDNATQKTSGEINLADIADNGGPTQTMALKSGSAAIDFGDDTKCAAAVGSPNYGAGGLDQRGVTRPQGTHCDTGAFEAGLIRGQKFDDFNGDGTKNGTDGGLGGWTIDLKNTSNQTLGSTTTDASGNYTLTVPALPFTYRVREVAQAGWAQTTPNPADLPLTLGTPGASNINFGNVQPADLSINKKSKLLNNNQQVQYTITVKNNGSADAKQVIVTDNLNISLHSPTITTDRGTCALAGTGLTCKLGKLTVGSSAKITILASLTSSSLLLHNCAAVTTTTFQSNPNKQSCVN